MQCHNSAVKGSAVRSKMSGFWLWCRCVRNLWWLKLQWTADGSSYHYMYHIHMLLDHFHALCTHKRTHTDRNTYKLAASRLLYPRTPVLSAPTSCVNLSYFSVHICPTAVSLPSPQPLRPLWHHHLIVFTFAPFDTWAIIIIIIGMSGVLHQIAITVTTKH